MIILSCTEERQKVCRKIKHAKKELDDAEVSPDNLPALRETLFSRRVDLNYVLVSPPCLDEM